MAFQSLRDFLAFLEKKGELKYIKQPVSTDLELTEISRRTLHQKGPALFFENVSNEKGKKMEIPVLTNLFGTINRVAMGMGRKEGELRELGKLLAFLKQPVPPHSLKEAWQLLPLFKMLWALRPKVVRKAPCQEVVLKGKEIDLDQFPIQTCWPGEPAPLITWPIVVTKGSDDKSYNLGIYRMQKLSKNQTLMRWLKHRGGAQHFEEWRQKQKKAGKPLSFPVAVALGADPGTILAAVTPVPETLSEYQFAGLLRGKPVELVACKTIPLKVPAHAEIILEGTIDLEDQRPEGPYGDHTGYYNSVEKFPVFTLSAITMRKKPIYLSTYTGKPPDEPSILGEALNELFIPLLQKQFPEITDFYLPPEACSYRIAIVQMKKAYPGHGKGIMMGVWSFLRQFLYTKWIILVDEDINIRDWREVMWAVSTRMDPVRDTTLIEGTPIDYLDFASPLSALGGKACLDATNKIPPETNREWGKPIHMDPLIKEKINQLWDELGI